MIEVILCLFGLSTLLSGKLKLSSARVIQGRPARTLGVLYLGVVPFDLLNYQYSLKYHGNEPPVVRVIIGSLAYAAAVVVATLAVGRYSSKATPETDRRLSYGAVVWTHALSSFFLANILTNVATAAAVALLSLSGAPALLVAAAIAFVSCVLATRLSFKNLRAQGRPESWSKCIDSSGLAFMGLQLVGTVAAVLVLFRNGPPLVWFSVAAVAMLMAVTFNTVTKHAFENEDRSTTSQPANLEGSVIADVNRSDAGLPPRLPPDVASKTRQTDRNPTASSSADHEERGFEFVVCPNCRVNVGVTRNRICPSCRTEIIPS